MSEQNIDEVICDTIEDKHRILEIEQQVYTADLLCTLEELKLDLLEAKMTIFEKDLEIIDLKRQLLKENS